MREADATVDLTVLEGVVESRRARGEATSIGQLRGQSAVSRPPDVSLVPGTLLQYVLDTGSSYVLV